VNDYRFKIFSGTANPIFGGDICLPLGRPLGKGAPGALQRRRINFQIWENVRGGDVFVVSSLPRPVDNHLLGTFVDDRRVKRASAWRITAVLPYYAMSRRTERQARVPISAKLVADLLEPRVRAER